MDNIDPTKVPHQSNYILKLSLFYPCIDSDIMTDGSEREERSKKTNQKAVVGRLSCQSSHLFFNIKLL